MSDLFDAPPTGAPRAGGVSVADAASWDRIVLASGQWPVSMAPQRPADADPEDEDADDLDDDLDDDEDDEDLDDDDDLEMEEIIVCTLDLEKVRITLLRIQPAFRPRPPHAP